jgi:hypothetical protein
MLPLRIIWGALLMGPIWTLVVLSIVKPNQPAQPNLHPLADYICMAMLVVGVPVGFAIRSYRLRSARAQGVDPMRGFVVGNIIFWATCEGTAFTSMILAFVSLWTWPLGVCTGVPLALQLLTFPRGVSGE